MEGWRNTVQDVPSTINIAHKTVFLPDSRKISIRSAESNAEPDAECNFLIWGCFNYFTSVKMTIFLV